MSAVYDLFADLGGLCPLLCSCEYLGVDVQLGQKEPCHVFGDTAVRRGGRGVDEDAHAVLDFLLHPGAHLGALLDLGKGGDGLVYGEGNLSPEVYRHEIVVYPQDAALGYVAHYGLVLLKLAKFVDGVVAGGNSVEAEVPAASHKLVAGGDVVCLELYVTFLAPALVPGLGNGHFVAYLKDEGPVALLLSPVLKLGVRPGSVLCNHFVVLHELVFGYL